MYLVVRPLLLRPTALERVPLKLLSFPFLAVLPNTGLILIRSTKIFRIPAVAAFISFFGSSSQYSVDTDQKHKDF